MRNFGLSELRLVSPASTVTDAWEDVCVPYAVFGRDVLDACTVCSNLEEAVSDCGLVLGTGATSRKNTPAITPRAAAELVGKLLLATYDKGESEDFLPPSPSLSSSPSRLLESEIAYEKNQNRAGNHREAPKVALVLGNERFGMSSEEVDLCSHTINIQTDAPMQKAKNEALGRSSLNLSHAAAIFFYEIFRFVKEQEGDFRSVPVQSTKSYKPLPFETKAKLRELLLASRRLLDVVEPIEGRRDEEERKMVRLAAREDEENLTSLIARNSLSAKDATVLFHLAQRIVALGKLTQEESLLGPLLRDAVSSGGEASGDMKDRVRRVAPTLSLSKQELRWLTKTEQGK